MEEQLNLALEKFKEVKAFLVKFENKEETVKYLVEETGIAKEECSNAYDFIMKKDLDNF